MQDLRMQERFEIEVLDLLNRDRILAKLVFCGGTMLRLCHGLDRYSVDLDFWLAVNINRTNLFNRIGETLGRRYKLTDAENKFYTLLFEVKSASCPSRLKIEIRKKRRTIETEKAIAFSSHAATQVLVTAASLPAMMSAKVEAFLDRREIRDVFDIEFLYKKGIALPPDPDTRQKLLRTIGGLKKSDYTVKLGSLLESDVRRYYATENFKILKSALKQPGG